MQIHHSEAEVISAPPVRGLINQINRIRTLGPQGTNCEAAAKHYVRNNALDADVVLHSTLEEAIGDVLDEPRSALLGCVVYPDLHNLVFPYLRTMVLADMFLFNTFNMVLATRPGVSVFDRVASHPAPQSLVSDTYPVILATSNAEAARMCRAGKVDACITTLPASRDCGLEVVEDFGEVPMGFTIHVPRH
jgi:prephenate dehydratase